MAETPDTGFKREVLPKCNGPSRQPRALRVLWPLIGEAGQPDMRVFRLADWTQANQHSSIPGAKKAVIDFGQA
jgi:hypothetical protein